MTIKKRLFISNILMILIPFIISLVTVWVGFFIINLLSEGALMHSIRFQREIQELRRPVFNEKMASVALLVMICFTAIMFITNRFLTRFVFRKIRQPLEMLSGGVREISEGNLDHRITYGENDEFTPVCEDFNNMAARLKVSVIELQRNEENRKELLAGISHDLLSPLTSIKGFVEGLLDGIAATPDAQREYLQIIKQKTDEISHMASQLFLYSKMDLDTFPIHPEVLDLSGELRDFVAASREVYRSKGLDILAAPLPEKCTVYADPVQLRSIFVNILDNSSKYNDKPSAEAIIDCVSGDDTARVIFEDNGPGIAEDALHKIFDVFYRGDPSRNAPREGSGLGLAIAAKAAKRMGGGISAQNIEKGGLRLIVEIPKAKEGIAE